jgi:hypothetical protein
MFIAKLRNVKAIDQGRHEIPSGPAALIQYISDSEPKIQYHQLLESNLSRGSRVSLLLLGITKYSRRVIHDHHHQKSHDMIENLYVTPSHRK